jgi:hypothetical protein
MTGSLLSQAKDNVSAAIVYDRYDPFFPSPGHLFGGCGEGTDAGYADNCTLVFYTRPGLMRAFSRTLNPEENLCQETGQSFIARH